MDAIDHLVREAGANLHLPDRLAQLQAQVDDRIARIAITASQTEYASRKLLDGSAGMPVIATDSDVIPLLATEETHPGVYAVTVTSAGRRAEIQAPQPQWYDLAADEQLTINGVSISLAAGTQPGRSG